MGLSRHFRRRGRCLSRCGETSTKVKAWAMGSHSAVSIDAERYAIQPSHGLTLSLPKAISRIPTLCDHAMAISSYFSARQSTALEEIPQFPPQQQPSLSKENGDGLGFISTNGASSCYDDQ
ncbi:hypothetical protein HPP92_028661 [Vanilla planifolia]|uniref:Uncharacterized protein n=1 Tax=Vanilla planifolia TaxID=51239 RepID=A0A835P527_VANPL|nr:hypothetical protein HPP92_028661 [Vanilla planifolia]KAG0446841.1 hypothetical protein HPP92_028654 [Vanilla planifolia]